MPSQRAQSRRARRSRPTKFYRGGATGRGGGVGRPLGVMPGLGVSVGLAVGVAVGVGVGVGVGVALTTLQVTVTGVPRSPEELIGVKTNVWLPVADALGVQV